MDKTQNWVPWKPTDIKFGEAYEVEALNRDNGITFVVYCSKNKIEIKFEGLVPAYTYSLEGIRTASWGQAQEKNKDKYFFTKWFLYKVQNSKFLNWALEESCGYYTKTELTHYCIVTQQSFMDILATSEPQITIISNNE